jgi:hypothetical protein
MESEQALCVQDFLDCSAACREAFVHGQASGLEPHLLRRLAIVTAVTEVAAAAVAAESAGQEAALRLCADVCESYLRACEDATPDDRLIACREACERALEETARVLHLREARESLS